MMLVCVLCLSLIEQNRKVCIRVVRKRFVILTRDKGYRFHDVFSAVINCRPVTLPNHLSPSGMMYFLRRGYRIDRTTTLARIFRLRAGVTRLEVTVRKSCFSGLSCFRMLPGRSSCPRSTCLNN